MREQSLSAIDLLGQTFICKLPEPKHHLNYEQLERLWYADRPVITMDQIITEKYREAEIKSPCHDSLSRLANPSSVTCDAHQTFFLLTARAAGHDARNVNDMQRARRALYLPSHPFFSFDCFIKIVPVKSFSVFAMQNINSSWGNLIQADPIYYWHYIYCFKYNFIWESALGLLQY